MWFWLCFVLLPLSSYATFLFKAQTFRENICENSRGCHFRCRFDDPGPITMCRLSEGRAEQCYKDGRFTLSVATKGELETALTVVIGDEESLVLSITNNHVEVLFVDKDNTQASLTKVEGRFKKVHIILDDVIVLRVDDRIPIVVDDNYMFKTVSKVESTSESAVVLYKSVALQDHRSECPCNTPYPLFTNNSCYTWNMTESVSVAVTPRVVSVVHKVLLPATLKVSVLYYTTKREEGEVEERVTVNGQTVTAPLQSSSTYYQPATRVSFVVGREGVANIEVMSTSNITDISILASCGCEECNVHSNFTPCGNRCSANTTTEYGRGCSSDVTTTPPGITGDVTTQPPVVTGGHGNVTEGSKSPVVTGGHGNVTEGSKSPVVTGGHGNVTEGSKSDSTTEGGAGTTTKSGNNTTMSGNNTTVSGQDTTLAPYNRTISGSSMTDNPATPNKTTTREPSEESSSETVTEATNKTVGPVTDSDHGTDHSTTTAVPFDRDMEGFTKESHAEGTVYTRLQDTNLTLLIRVKKQFSRTKRSVVAALRDTKVLFRTFCERNNCSRMSEMDLLTYTVVDTQTIEHTDTLQSYTSYLYTFMTEEFKITKRIVTAQKEPEVVNTIKMRSVSKHVIEVDWAGVFRPNNKVMVPGCFVITVIAGNVTTTIKADVTSILLNDLHAGRASGRIEVQIPSQISNTDIKVEVTLRTEMGNVTATSSLAAEQHIARSVITLSIVFGVLGTLLLIFIIVYISYRVRKNAAHSYHFNPNVLRQEYRPSEIERSKLTNLTNQTQSTIHHNRIAQAPEPKDDNITFQVKRVNATENLLAESRSQTPPPSAPPHAQSATPHGQSAAPAALAAMLRYEITQSESSGSITQCQAEIRDKAVTLTSQDGCSQTYL